MAEEFDEKIEPPRKLKPKASIEGTVEELQDIKEEYF